ncbi:hypothetical protein [Umezawaea beigongshangensis]|uniref:hypothetical protein n=1 Tax=Umezawaea beigongshangensis TaxID=2780383 RepID=UPI0018F18360|nr:hypothetical protein [Umezawaea beigongshangensis]
MTAGAFPKDQHGFALTGTSTVYGSHLAMFNMAQHRFHVVIRVDLPQSAQDAYASARRTDPKSPVIVVNPESSKMHLQDMLGADGFPAELWQLPDNDFGQKVVLSTGFTAKAAQVLHNRPFDDQEAYPPEPRYLVFGSGGEAHASHYLTHQPDYQLLVQLAATPTGLTGAQLAASTLVDLTSVTEDHEPVQDPLASHLGEELPARIVDSGGAVTLKIGPSRWFDTRELNHEPHGHAATLSEYIALASV